MKEDDPLNSVLREWEAPEPSPSVDARIRTAYQAAHQPSPWRRLWFARISIPVPAMAALLLLVAVMGWLQLRSRPVEKQPGIASPTESEYVTRIEIAGYQPLPNGETRIIRAGGSRP